LSKEPIIVALDVGSAKTAVIIAQATVEGDIRFIALGTAETKGLRKGQVSSLDLAATSIRQAVDEAERLAGLPVESTILGVGGGYIAGFNSRGGLGLGNRPRDVTREDVRRAVDAARQVRLPEGSEVLHVLPQGFWLDAQNGIRDPIGMVGRQLDVNVHLVTSPAVLAQNMVASVNRAGLMVSDLVLEPLAAAECVLSADERELGACLLDIGAGTAELLVYANGAVRHTAAIAIGGNHFTNDLAVGIRTPILEAERIKCEEVWSETERGDQERSIEIPCVGDRPPRSVPAREVAEILDARAQELLGLVRKELERAGLLAAIPAGLVLVGGGGRLQGLEEMAEKILAMPARLGRPRGLAGLPEEAVAPEFAAIVGLALYGGRQQQAHGEQPTFSARLKGLFLG